MKATTRGIAVLLTCVGCASAVAAQAPQDTYTRVSELRQESNSNSNKAQTQNDARQRANAEKAEAARQRRGGPARGGQRRTGDSEATKTFSRIVRLERGGTFDLQNYAGDVTITGGGGRDASIEAIKKVRSITNARAQALLPMIRIDVAERGGNVEVHTMHPRGPSQVTVDYIVRLPENTNVIVRSTTGNLHIQNMSGDELNANTLSGNVVARDLRSRVIELHSVQGNMQLQDIAVQRAILQTMAGNLEFAGRLLKTGRYQLQTHGGDIRVTPSGNPGFDLEAMTYRGDLRSDYSLRVIRPPAGVPAVLRGPRIQKVLRGTVGDAGAMLTTSTFSGNVVIAKPEGQ
jgi:DUF4097 and DUF4098 domain-containing protein YvlB